MRGYLGRKEAIADEATLQLLRKASPINHIHEGLPPFLLVHGTGDMSVLYNWSPLFQSKLKAAGATVTSGSFGIGKGGLDAKAALFWLFVGIPLAWGIWKTVQKAVVLFV